MPVSPSTDEPDPSSHPRYKQWLDECKLVAAAAREENPLKQPPPPPPFHIWLKIKEEEESPVPRIKGENPPISYLHKAALIAMEKYFATFALYPLGGATFLTGYAAFTETTYSEVIRASLFLLAILLGIAVISLNNQIEAKKKDVERHRALIPLDAYNTEFVCLLANRSTIRITVHFQIPQELNASTSASPYGSAPATSHFVEQLNRVTEASLISFCRTFTSPPSESRVEDHLQRDLVRFQNENNVAVLRVNVPIIDPPPEQPKNTYV